MPSSVARSAKTPLATRRPASDDEEVLELAEDADVAVGVDVATAFTPPVTGPLSDTVCSFEPMAFAAAKKLAAVLPEDGALIEPTIPLPQCCDALQKNQTGSWSFVIVIVKSFEVCRPESKPADEPLAAAKYVQGFANVDCVTE